MTGVKSAIARLFGSNGAVVGAGMLVDATYVLTCAHVVAAALGVPDTTSQRPVGQVHIDFPLVEARTELTATIADWHPVGEAGPTADIAVLELDGSLPAGAAPTELLQPNEYWGHRFRAFGFPPGFDQGQWATGLLRDEQAGGWVQIEDVKSTGYFVVPGFSGTPVWDDDADGVVGIVVGSDTRVDVRAAFFIPAPVLVQAWPTLSGSVARDERRASEMPTIVTLLDPPALPSFEEVPEDEVSDVFNNWLIAMVQQFFEKVQIVIDRGSAHEVAAEDLFAVLAGREEITGTDGDVLGSVNREAALIRVIDAQEKMSICQLENWSYQQYLDEMPTTLEAFVGSDGNMDLDALAHHPDVLWPIRKGQLAMPIPRDEKAGHDAVDELYGRTLADTATSEEKQFLYGEMVRKANELLLDHATGYFAAEAMFQRGYAQFQLGRFRDAIESFELFLRRYPFSVSAPGARDWIDQAQSELKKQTGSSD